MQILEAALRALGIALVTVFLTGWIIFDTSKSIISGTFSIIGVPAPTDDGVTAIIFFLTWFGFFITVLNNMKKNHESSGNAVKSKNELRTRLQITDDGEIEEVDDDGEYSLHQS